MLKTANKLLEELLNEGASHHLNSDKKKLLLHTGLLSGISGAAGGATADIVVFKHNDDDEYKDFIDEEECASS